jgi:hypothetical protein
MKKNIPFLFLLASVVIVLASCGNKAASSDPKTVLKEFFTRLSKKDIDGASQLATKESKSTLDLMKKGMEMAEKMDQKMPEDKEFAEEFKNVEFGDAKITGETAIVPVKHTKRNENTEFTLKKQDGAWKVDFSMAALRNMDKSGAAGMDGMTEDGEEVTQEQIDQSMKMMDSLMKDPEKMKQLKEQLEKYKDQQ